MWGAQRPKIHSTLAARQVFAGASIDTNDLTFGNK
jgi:hypothetical protein